MNTDFKSSFLRDIKKISDKNILALIESMILKVESAQGIHDIPDIKKLKGFKTAYRIKINDFRIGMDIADDGIVTFVRCLHRKDVYKFFP